MTKNETPQAAEEVPEDEYIRFLLRERDKCKTQVEVAKEQSTIWYKQAEKYKKALEEIEWQANGHFCYVCTAEKCKGHWPDCPIGQALSETSPTISE